MCYSSKSVLGAAAVLLFAACAARAQSQPTTNAERASRDRMARDAAESDDREMMFELIERYHRSGEER
ncbi:MAG TPA: hypothetical protein VJ866_09035, partial [Pyrinomonadaceae bacterium]|nr:hypothetical protein [Pyrinomonadaceae bacterium]